MKYTVVSAYDLYDLIEQVNEKLEQGWKLPGDGIRSIPDNQGVFLYVQVMIFSEPAAPVVHG